MKIFFYFSFCFFYWFTPQAQVDTNVYNKLEKIQLKSSFSGFSVATVDLSGFLHLSAHGFADKEAQSALAPHTPMIVASVSKTWIGIALMQCVERGLLHLDSNINQYLNFKVHNPNHINKAITVRMLANHTSSIGYTIPDIHKIKFQNKPNPKSVPFMYRLKLRKINQQPTKSFGTYLESHLSLQGNNYKSGNFSKNPPGARYKYSNMAALLASYIVERVSGLTFEAYCQQYIIAPLNLRETTWTDQNIDQAATQYIGSKQIPAPRYTHHFYPTGGLRTSAYDLGEFLIEMLRGYQGQGKLLSAHHYQELFKGQFNTQKPLDFPNNETNHGVFWTHRGSLIGHTGGGLGASSFMFFDTKTGLGKLFISNCELESNKSLIPYFIEIWGLLTLQKIR